MDTQQLQICNNIIKKNTIEIIDLKCIDLTSYLTTFRSGVSEYPHETREGRGRIRRLQLWIQEGRGQ